MSREGGRGGREGGREGGKRDLLSVLLAGWTGTQPLAQGGR